MTVAVLAPVAPESEPDTYRGVAILRLHVDDPIPTPRSPQRFAVRIHPDLARYLLTYNHPQNRPKKPTAIARYVRDLVAGAWAFTPESIVFSISPHLEDGQNRLHAIIESGVTVWMMVDFGWPADLIEVINRASARTNADAFAVNGVSNRMGAAAAIGIADKYRSTFDTPVRWTQRILTSSEALDIYRRDPMGWGDAATAGARIYASVQGLGNATWIAAYYLISEAAGRGTADKFFAEVIDETGEAGSATRRLKSHYLRRKVSDTASGDSREPMENIVRAFNAWAADKPVGFVRTGGAFVLSRIRP
jgi:hypothetical protein